MFEKQKILDLYFMEARSHLIEVAAILDRIERHGETLDFRWQALHQMIEILGQNELEGGRVKTMLEALSDQTKVAEAKAKYPTALGAAPENYGIH